MGSFGNDLDWVIGVIVFLAIIGALALIGALIWALLAFVF